MPKDPAVLFFISDWLTATAEMDADIKGWYLDLILHNYDKGSLPNEIEKLAKLAGVKFSEYERFKQVFEQVLKHKFDILENGRLSNEKTSKILQSREIFKDKRSMAGKISYLMRFFAKYFSKEYKNQSIKKYIKDNFDYNLDLTNEQVIKQVFKHLFELYRNENEYEDESINKNKLDIPEFSVFLNYAKSEKPLIDEYHVKAKYDSWVENGWRDGHDKIIKNWKTKLKNTIPFLKEKESEINLLNNSITNRP